MVPHRFWMPILALALTLPLAAQVEYPRPQDLALSPDDIRVVQTPDGGYGLFVRQKPAIASVHIIPDQRTLYDVLPEDSRPQRPVVSVFRSNFKDRAWYFVSDAAEPDRGFDLAFHFTIPPEVEIQIDPPDGPAYTIPVKEGFGIVIRTFATRNPDSASFHQDTFYRISPTVVPEAVAPEAAADIPAAAPEVVSPEEESADIPAAAPEVVSPEEESADIPAVVSEEAAAEPVEEPRARPPLKRALSLIFGVSFFNPGNEGAVNGDLRLLTRLEPVGALSYTHTVTEVLGYEVRMERDPLLMNRLIGRGIWKNQFFTLEAGLFLGLFNPDPGFLNPGISAILKVPIPLVDKLSGSVRLDTSIRRSLDSDGDFLQDMQEYGVAYIWTPFSFGFTLTNREFARRLDNEEDITSSWIRYNLSARYTNSFLRYPFALGLHLGYQDLRWNYHIPSVPEYRYHAWYVGLEGWVAIRPDLELTLSLEAPVYPVDYLADSQNPYLINVQAGLRWTF